MHNALSTHTRIRRQLNSLLQSADKGGRSTGDGRLTSEQLLDAARRQARRLGVARHRVRLACRTADNNRMSDFHPAESSELSRTPHQMLNVTLHGIEPGLFSLNWNHI